jgi:hypothetical protein
MPAGPAAGSRSTQEVRKGEPMPRVRISPALGYAHGHIDSLLIQDGITPPTPRRPDGIVEMDLTEAQVARFQLRGNAHRIQWLTDGQPAEQTPAPAEAAPAAIEADSAFVTLQCPFCGREFNLIKALVSGGSTGTECLNCLAKMQIENFKIVRAVKHGEAPN